MKAIVKIDIPDYQIGQEVTVCFKDSMTKKGICQKDYTENVMDILDEWGKRSVDSLFYGINGEEKG